MKALITYFVIGCVFYGLGAGSHMKRCPRDDTDKIELNTLVAIIIWPSWVVIALVLVPGEKYEPSKCKAPAQ